MSKVYERGAPQALQTLNLYPASEVALTIFPLDYGTVYDGQGTADAYRFFSGQGSQATDNILIQGVSRSDLTFGQGYNCNSNGARVRTDEISWLRNTEFGYYQDTEITPFNLTGAPTYSAGTGYSTVVTAGTPFTASMVDTCAVWFASEKAYPIVEFVSTSSVVVRGDASAESTTGIKVWYKGVETYDQLMYLDQTTVRVNNVNFRPHNKQIAYVQRATSHSFRREENTVLMQIGGSAIGDSDVYINAGNLYLIKSSGQVIYGKNSSNAISGIISLDNATNWIGLGQSTLTNGIRLGVPLLAGNDAVTGIFLGNGTGKTGGAQGETKVINFTGCAYGADGMLPRLYLEHPHIAIKVLGVADGSGQAELRMGTGTTWAGLDTNLFRKAADTLATDDHFRLNTAGRGFHITEGGAAAFMGTVTASGTSNVDVATTSVIAASRIFFGCITPGGTPGQPQVGSISAGTKFVFKSTAGDTSVYAWLMINPAT